MSSPEKLIIVSLVEGGWCSVQAWRVGSLEDNLRRQRRQWTAAFLPVAAVEADPAVAKKVLGLDRFPVSVSAEWAASTFSRTRICAPAQRAVFRHYRIVGGRAVDLFAEWSCLVGEAQSRAS